MQNLSQVPWQDLVVCQKYSKYSQIRHKLTLKRSVSPVQFQIKQELNAAEASSAMQFVKEESPVVGNEQHQDNMVSPFIRS
jgi:hypothetical protein